MFKTLRVLAAFFYVAVFALVMPSPSASASIAEQPCNQVSWTQEDDVAHEMLLPYSLPLGDTTYSTTYVTTNGTLTFGTPDPTFHTYPSTPSISLAGWDWVTWNGGHLSYGVTETGFCVEWYVRPFPQSSGDFTTIKLTVDTSRLPTWSGIVETTGWLPADLRRGIRFQSGEEVVQISEAFTINGGRPVEMQTCWDGTIIPMSGTCPAEPPPGQCWDGSTVAYNETCPPVPPDTQCWDGTWVAWSQTCPQQPPPIECWNGTSVNWDQQCPPVPPNIICWDNSSILWNQVCPVEPTPSPTPTQSQSPEPSVEPTPTPTEPSPQPTETSSTPEPTPSPELTPTPSETPSPLTPEEPLPTSAPETPEPSPTPTPEPTVEPEPIIEPVEEVVNDASADGVITEAETQEIIDNLLSDGDLSSSEVTDFVDNLQSDGTFSQEEKELVADVLVAAYEDSAIPADVFEESGLDYEDLPPEQPITLDNGVVITADIADAIEIFEDPSELLATVFTDPSKALKAIGNVGADMTIETRKEAQTVTVAAVIVTQVIAGTSALTLARK